MAPILSGQFRYRAGSGGVHRDSLPLIVTGSFDGRRVTNHLALSDATGDTMVIEYIGGKPVIHHGKQYTVMTNSPPYDQQLKQLQQFKGFGGEKPLPGTTEAADRFVRGAYYLNDPPKPADYRETVAGALSVIRHLGAVRRGRPRPAEHLRHPLAHGR